MLFTPTDHSTVGIASCSKVRNRSVPRCNEHIESQWYLESRQDGTFRSQSILVAAGCTTKLRHTVIVLVRAVNRRLLTNDTQKCKCYTHASVALFLAARPTLLLATPLHALFSLACCGECLPGAPCRVHASTRRADARMWMRARAPVVE